MGGKRAGLTEEQTVTIGKGEVDFEPKLGALLTLVRASVSDVGYVPDEVWQSALAAGWRDAELTEVSVHIALNLFTNHFNHLVETDLDIPTAPASDRHTAQRPGRRAVQSRSGGPAASVRQSAGPRRGEA